MRARRKMRHLTIPVMSRMKNEKCSSEKCGTESAELENALLACIFQSYISGSAFFNNPDIWFLILQSCRSVFDLFGPPFSGLAFLFDPNQLGLLLFAHQLSLSDLLKVAVGYNV